MTEKETTTVGSDLESRAEKGTDHEPRRGPDLEEPAEQGTPDERARAGEDDVTTGLRAQVAEAEEARARAEEARDQTHDQFLRLRAEFENFRRRSREDLALAREQAIIDFMGRLLPVIEDLERAVEASDNDSDSSAIKEGLVLVTQQLEQVLGREGVRRIDPRGETFDEQFMEAVGAIPSDTTEEGRVIEVMKVGHMLGDRLIRAAQVLVSAGPPPRGDDVGDEDAP